MNNLFRRYGALKEQVIERSESFNDLMAYLETETEWLTAPASTRFHLSKQEGLLEHSCNVAETMLKLKAAIAPGISTESCIIVALLHDLGKVGMPDKPQYLKDDKCLYRYNYELTYLSVPVRSIYLTLPHLQLTEEEVQAIIYHDGQYVEDNASVARREKPLTLLLQYADTWCGFILEKRKWTANEL